MFIMHSVSRRWGEFIEENIEKQLAAPIKERQVNPESAITFDTPTTPTCGRAGSQAK